MIRVTIEDLSDVNPTTTVEGDFVVLAAHQDAPNGGTERRELLAGHFGGKELMTALSGLLLQARKHFIADVPCSLLGALLVAEAMELERLSTPGPAAGTRHFHPHVGGSN
jgi:hypothetical protein